MAVEVTMPKLGLTMETGKITEWKKAEGETVKKGEILLVVETEKITYEVECPADGVLHIVVPVEGEVPVAELIGVIAADKAEYDKVAAARRTRGSGSSGCSSSTGGSCTRSSGSTGTRGSSACSRQRARGRHRRRPRRLSRGNPRGAAGRQSHHH